MKRRRSKILNVQEELILNVWINFSHYLDSIALLFKMSHGEIWDDSSLVDSWNDALEEYKASDTPITCSSWLIF